MNENGVPSEAMAGDDHMQVRPALVVVLGGGNEALVWTRIEFRARHVSFAHAKDGRQWWQVTRSELVAETGLKLAQVETAVNNLVKKGFLLAEQHALPMQTMSYSPVIIQSGDSRIGTGPDRESQDSSSEIPGLQTGDSRIPLYIQEEEEVEEAPIVPTPDEVFEAAWSHWPKKTDKKLSRQRFDKAIAGRPQLPDEVTLFGDAYAIAEPDVSFVPNLASWIYRARWDDPLPKPTVSRSNVRAIDSLSVVARLREEEAHDQQSGRGRALDAHAAV